MDIDYSKLSRQQKLAIFMIVVGPEAAAELLRQFDDAEAELLCREMSTFTLVPDGVQRQVLEELSGLLFLHAHCLEVASFVLGWSIFPAASCRPTWSVA